METSVVNWSSVFCMFGMALTRPSLTCVRAKGGHFEQLLWNIQPYDKTRFSFFVKCDTNFRLFFKIYTTNSNFNFRKVVRQHTKGMVGNVIWVLFKNLLIFLAVKEFWKSVKNWQSYRHEFVVLLFGTQCISRKQPKSLIAVVSNFQSLICTVHMTS